MEFRILGPLEVLEDGRQIDLGSAKQRALLAILLLHGNEVLSTDRLIEALWEDEPPETAQKALQVYVSQLRKVLGRDRLETKAPGYRLLVAPDELDLERFQRLAEERPREALALWRGHPLAEFAYERFAQSEIARIEELHVTCLERRVEEDLEQGRHSAAIGELERLVREHPLRERLRAQFMLALYRSGRQAEALEAFQDARRALTEELGIEPGQELRDLQQRILRQDASLVLPEPLATAEAAVEPTRGVFVGRERELEELQRGLDDAFAVRGCLVLVVGEPGIGKSRLTDEIARQARVRGARVLIGRCWEAGGAPAYWPWVQSVRMYLEQGESETLRTQLGRGAADVAQIVPELRELFPDLPEPTTEEEGARFRLFDSVARFLKNAAAAQPVVLVLDDLHAADEPSLLMLRFMAGELGGSRILVLGTYRDVDPTVRDPLASTLAELAREQVTRRIELEGLTEPAVARFVELNTDLAPSPELISVIHAETEGNPLFVGEVVRLLASEGRLVDADAADLRTLGVPQGVREVIGRRLRRLSEGCVEALTLASILGREFRLDALEALSDLSPDELLQVLDEAVSARVLASVPGARGRLRFAHGLIRETLYDGLTTLRRVQLHGRAGEALEMLYTADPDPHLAELAYHFFEAAPGGNVEKAVAYARRAADRALELLAYEEAARLYGLGLEALDLAQPPDPVARCALLLGLGDAEWKTGDTPEAKETFLTAAALARTSKLPEYLARAALGYSGRFPWLRAGNDRRLVPLLTEALGALGEEESALRARLLARLAGALRDEPSLEPRTSLSREAVAIARRLDDADTLGYALVSLALAPWGPENEELRAIETIAEEVRGLAEATGDTERVLHARWLQVIAWMTEGDTARVAPVIDEYRELADELKQPSQQWYGALMRQTWALFRGEFSRAERLMEEMLQIGQPAQSWDAELSHRVELFFLRREQGRLQEIEELIRRSVDEYSGYRLFRCVIPLLACELGKTEEAQAALDEVAEHDFEALPRDCEWLLCLSILSEVAAFLEDSERAAALYRLLLPYSQLNVWGAGEIAMGSVARYLGLTAATAERWHDAARCFEEALQMNERMGARPWLAHTQEDYARMLLARGASGDTEKAERLLDEALTTYHELGMTGALERARAFARA